MPSSPLHALHAAGQSIWLDYIDRAMLRSGDLARRIRDEALTGMTSNPTIFEKALAEGTAYDAQLGEAPAGQGAWELFELVETTDVRDACDIFMPVYEQSKGTDGFVSIEVSPGVANDADATVEEGRRLWATVGRPNVMIKVPGTTEGAKAVRRLIDDGINVNVTLLFSVEAYRHVIDAFIDGLASRAAAGHAIERVASVASFFISRVDSAIDARLEKLASAAEGAERERILALKGQAAIVNAKLAYALFRESFAGARWAPLHALNAQVQRPLWASTSTKNPAYRDVLYVEQLIGPHTVNTMPPATLDAFREHGEVAQTIDVEVDEARRVLADLESLGISIAEVTETLLRDGLASFQKSFDGLVAGLERKSALLGRATVAR